MSPSGLPPVPLRETCRVVGGRLPLWPWHRARLLAGGCGGELLDRVQEAAATSAARERRPSSRTRLTVVVSAEGTIEVDIRQRLSSLDVPGSPRTAFVPVEEAPWLPPGAAKPADRSPWDRAQRRARWSGADQALLVHDGLVIDGGSASVWTVDGGVLSTPPAPDAVAGVARAFLLDAAGAARLTVSVRPLTPEAYLGAEEAFLTNAFGGAVAVRGRGGVTFGRVSDLFAAMWAGR